MFNFGFIGVFSTNIFPSVCNGNMGEKRQGLGGT